MDYMKLARVAYEEVRADYNQHTCIGMAAALLTTLKLAGEEGAFPLTVRAHITNPAFTRRRASAALPPTQEQVEKWGRQDGSFQASIGFDLKQEGKGWPGHLVVIVPDAVDGRTLMFDLTIMQAEQPQHDIHLRPVILAVKPEFLNGEQPFGLKVNGCQVMYKASPNDKSYEETPVWQSGQVHDLLAMRILARL